jgi:hypothetical protein
MAYSLKKTNGSTLLNLADGVANGPDVDVNTAVASVNLIGKNKSSYGFYLNENFIKLLENFAYSIAPVSPITGQIWWDTTNSVLKVYNGTAWKEIAHSASGSTSPSNAISGDLWWNSTASTLNVYSGSSWITIGPAIPPGAAVTQFINNALTDPLAAIHNVGNVVVNNKLAAVVSTESTAFTVSTPVLGQTTIAPGFIIDKNLVVGGNISSTGISSLSTINATTVNASTVNAATIGNSGATLTGTISTASQTNITSLGTLSGLTIAGDLRSYRTPGTTGVVYLSSSNSYYLYWDGTNYNMPGGNWLPSAAGTYNLGSPTQYFNTLYGKSTSALYADLAERFAADQPMSPGTVVALGGTAEITVEDQELSETVFGVISTQAAYLMNATAGTDATHPAVAVQGRVPVQVTGIIHKGDRLVSAGNGRARAGARDEITAWNVIGRALVDKLDLGPGVIEAIVQLNS